MPSRFVRAAWAALGMSIAFSPVAGQDVPGSLPSSGPLARPAMQCGAAPFVEGRFDTGEVTLAYSEGPPNGPVILFLPGMGVPRGSYHAAAGRLCDRFHVIVLDQRGQGQSGWARDGRYRVVDYGRDLVAFIRGQLAGQAVIISGHSLGGLVALWLAAEHPELTFGLNAEDNPFLMSERGRWETHWIKPMFEALEHRLRVYHENGENPEVLRDSFANERMMLPRQDVPYQQRVRAMGKLLAGLRARGMSPPDAAVRAWIEGTPVTFVEFLPEAARNANAVASATMDPGVVHAAVTAELNDGFDHRAAMMRVQAPTLYWNSDQDLVGVIDQEEHDANVALIARQARTRHVVAAGIGHLIHAEMADRYADEIADFFLPSMPR